MNTAETALVLQALHTVGDLARHRPHLLMRVDAADDGSARLSWAGVGPAHVQGRLPFDYVGGPRTVPVGMLAAAVCDAVQAGSWYLSLSGFRVTSATTEPPAPADVRTDWQVVRRNVGALVGVCTERWAVRADGFGTTTSTSAEDGSVSAADRLRVGSVHLPAAVVLTVGRDRLFNEDEPLHVITDGHRIGVRSAHASVVAPS
jgi:hypothetical protein